MNKLIQMNDGGLFFAKISNREFCDSIYVAKLFNKEHKNVLRSIRDLIDKSGGIASEFAKSNFWGTYYKNSQNKNQPCYALTKEGYMLLVMGFIGEEAIKYKIDLINCFSDS